MATIKISKKVIIENIQAKMNLQLGKKFTQQEVVDLCVEFGNENLDQLMIKASVVPKLTPEKAKMILNKIQQISNLPYDENLSLANQQDKDIYSL